MIKQLECIRLRFYEIKLGLLPPMSRNKAIPSSTPLDLFLWGYLKNRVYHRISHGVWQLTNVILKEKIGPLWMILWKRSWWIFAQDWNMSWTKKGPKLSIGSRIKDTWEGSLKFLQLIFIDVFKVTCEFHWVSTMFKQKNNKLILGTIFFGPPWITFLTTIQYTLYSIQYRPNAIYIIHTWHKHSTYEMRVGSEVCAALYTYGIFNKL